MEEQNYNWSYKTFPENFLQGVLTLSLLPAASLVMSASMTKMEAGKCEQLNTDHKHIKKTAHPRFGHGFTINFVVLSNTKANNMAITTGSFPRFNYLILY